MSEHEIEHIVVLLLAVVALASLASRVRLPYPMVLLVGGVVLALMPGLPQIDLDPHLVFVLFLPPVLFYAAFFTSWRDFKGNINAIGTLATGCVLLTTAAVAIAARWLIPDMPWAVALTLGAIVSPPDAIAATAIFQRLGVPHRVITILEGESLVNDASALIAYRFAVAAAVGGTFSIADASLQFAIVGIGGVVFGLACGWLAARATLLLRDVPVANAFTLLLPISIYVIAERFHVSGVLAVVTAGLFFGRRSSAVSTPKMRVTGRAVWDTMILIVNGVVFILIGLQLPHVVDAVHEVSVGMLVAYSLVISLVVIVARFVWVFPATYVYRWVIPGMRERDPFPQMRDVTIVSWSGLRGVVSLAAALALPLTADDGAEFPYRNDIIFIAFGVIVVTLLGQGLLIPLLIRKLGVSSDGRVEVEIRSGRLVAAEAAMAYMDRIEGDDWVPADHLKLLRYRYSHEAMHLNEIDAELDDGHLEMSVRLGNEVIDAARMALVEARDDGVIGDDARIRIEADLDLERMTHHI